MLSVECTIIALVVSMRTYIRINKTKFFWWDDATMLLAAVGNPKGPQFIHLRLTLALQILTLCSNSLNFVTQVLTVDSKINCNDQSKAKSITPFLSPTITLATLGLMAARTSVALLLWRLFSISRPLKWILVPVTLLMVAASILSIILLFAKPAVALSRPGGLVWGSKYHFFLLWRDLREKVIYLQ